MGSFAQRLIRVTKVSSPLNDTAPPPYPTYTDYPVIEYATLWADAMAGLPVNQRTPMSGPGSNVGQVLGSMDSFAYVRLPDGFEGELIDFSFFGVYALYAPKCMGIWGPSSDPSRAIIRFKEMSSTQASAVPPQTDGDANGDGTSNPLTLMRLGPCNSSTVAAVHCHGWTLAGTDQPDGPNGEPHNYSGLTDYYGTNSTYNCMKIMGVPGDWNSPPGETFQFASYHATGSTYEYMEVDGYNEAGRQVGGGVGNNASNDVTFKNCNFHDAYVSGGPIFSGAGGPNGTMCRDVKSINVRSYNNANHIVPNPGGKNFGGLNHEGVYGSVLHDHPEIFLDNQAVLQNRHVFIGNTQVDCPDFVINEPEWHPELGYPAATNGAFTVGVPVNYAGTTNKQTTYPTVIKNGVTLQPVLRAPGAGWPSGVNPATQYIVIR